MSREPTSPIWPLCIVLVFGFAMTWTAPRGWERVARWSVTPPSIGQVNFAKPPQRAVVLRGAPSPSMTPREVGRAAAPSGRIAAEYSAVSRLPATSRSAEVEPAATPTVAAAPEVVALNPAAIRDSIDEALSAPQPENAPEASAPLAVREPASSYDEIDVEPTIERPRLSLGLRRPSAARPAPVAESAPVAGPAPTSIASSISQPVETGPDLSAPSTPAVGELAVAATKPNPHAALPAPVVQPKPAPVAAPAPPPSWWPVMADLTSRLDRLANYPTTARWSNDTKAALKRLQATDGVGSSSSMSVLADLRAADRAAEALEAVEADVQTAVELRLARHALQRRLDVWEAFAALAPAEKETVPAARLEQLALCLGELDRQAEAAGETGRQWSDYLMLAPLHRAAGEQMQTEERRELARTVIERIRRASAVEQHEFLHHGPYADLQTHLRELGAEPTDVQRLFAELERFETNGLPSTAEYSARLCDDLAQSGDPAKLAAAERLAGHYRNANLRVTFSPTMLNRFLPEALKKQAPVVETILGKPTRGWSNTSTGLSVRFIPSPDRLSVSLDAQGLVNAQTRTFSGPVRLFNHSNSLFAAEKRLELSTDGIVASPAAALSHNDTRLRGVESDFDKLPILGSIVASIAQSQHAEKKPAAQREVALKTSQRVERYIDEEIAKHLQQADAKLQDRVLTPLAALGIHPEIVDLQTTEERATMRFRVAGSGQLAAHTPRPRAFADNVASVQVHQSAINNTADRLQLQGRRFSLPELHQHVVRVLHLPPRPTPERVPAELHLQFAEHDPLTIRCDGGVIELRLAVAELSHGDRVWRNFTIRAPFRPTTIDGTAYFVRDDVVRISGPTLGTGQQISLRAVFAKVFPEDLQIRVWPERLATDPRFADLDIEQIDIRDGWLNIAVRPEQPLTGAPPVPQTTTLPRLFRR